MTGTSIVHVPYKGAGPAMADVLAGRVQLYFATLPAAMPHVKRGNSSRSRSRARGARRQCGTAYGRRDRLARLRSLDLVRAARAGAHRARGDRQAAPGNRETPRRPGAAPEAREQGFEPLGNSPEEFGAYIRSEIAKWSKVIRDAGIRLE